MRAHDQIAAIGTAVFQAQSFLQVSANGYTDPTDATFAYDASGKPVPQTPVKIWVSFAVPTTAMPASGYPTVIVQHGLSGSRRTSSWTSRTCSARRAGWSRRSTA